MFTPIPIATFEQRLGVSKNEIIKTPKDITYVVSLRQLVTIDQIQVMPSAYLERILQKVVLQGTRTPVYDNCTITTCRMDPHNLLIGQTFIQRDKYQDFLENFSEIFSEFCITRGVAKCTALIALGKTQERASAMAHYLPPIVEENQGKLCLLDGIHRNFLVKMVGTTLETIIIKNVTHNFPCDLHDWKSIQVVDKKPPKEKRYFNLREELFRDLKIIGIDG